MRVWCCLWGVVVALTAAGCAFETSELESRECVDDAVCVAKLGAGFICEADFCVAGCQSAADCSEGGDCDVGTSRCIAANCQDLLLNGDETDVDCGGSCAPCEPGLICSVNEDCESAVCADAVCATPSCDDGILNGSERDVDCGGGTCAPCTTGQRCNVDADCESRVCVDAACVDATCDDGVLNGDEVDVDCGLGCTQDCPAGTCVKLCLDGESCAEGGDCYSGVCSGGVCASPACNDGYLNGFEVDQDCGGPICDVCSEGGLCSDNAGCATGSCRGLCANTVDPCREDSDCGGGACEGPFVCRAASCTDGVANGSETDVDCGGDCVVTCDDGERCLADSDCTSSVCDEGAERCVQAGCQDEAANGDETDVDCGGPECAPCGAGLACNDASDCESGVCADGTCAEATCTDGLVNGSETDQDCGGANPECPRCADDLGCELGSDCVSGVCDRVGGTCRVPDCNDGVKNGAETGVDCGGPICRACDPGEGCNEGSDCESLICDSQICGYYAQDCTVLFESGVSDDGAYTIDPDGEGGAASFDAYCLMSEQGGGWTLALKADGRLETFRYDKGIWTNTDLLNPTSTSLSRTEAKFQVFNSVTVEEVLVSFVSPPDSSGQTRGVTLPVSSSSLHALFNGGYVATSAGRSTWLGLISGSDIQNNCNREGFNVKPANDGGDSRARIGIVGNNEDNCNSPDSRLGVGTQGDNGASTNIAVGNSAGWNGVGNGRNIEAFAYVLVRSKRR